MDFQKFCMLFFDAFQRTNRRLHQHLLCRFIFSLNTNRIVLYINARKMTFAKKIEAFQQIVHQGRHCAADKMIPSATKGSGVCVPFHMQKLHDLIRAFYKNMYHRLNLSR